MELELEPFRIRGRAAQPPTAVRVRELDPADIALLGEEKGSAPPPIKRIGERHHALARALASGMAPREAAITVGYNSSRVSILLSDPTFQELLSFYRADVNAQYRDLHSRLAGLAMDAAEELGSRLEEDPESFSIGQLMEATKLGADRTGHGPQSSTTNLNVNVDLAARLASARERVAQRKLESQNAIQP